MELIRGFSIWLEGQCEGDKANAFFRYEEPIEWSRLADGKNFELDHHLFRLKLRCSRRARGAREVVDMEVQFEPRVSMTSRRVALIVHPEGRCPRIFDRHGELREPLLPWYWLGPSGLVELGQGNEKCVLTAISGFSSVEFGGFSNQIWLNLDYANDHLHVKDDPEHVFKNMSYERMEGGKVRNARFRILAGVGLENLLLPVVHRGEAWGTAVWTEHACVSAEGSQRAVFFGSSEISRVEDAHGGFAGHGIPVSKSVFFANPNKSTVDSQSQVFKGETNSLQGSPGFRDLVDRLYGAGLVEVGLHCIAPESVSMSLAAEAIRDLSDKYRSRFWIDHVWFKKGKTTSGSREGFTLDGGGLPGQTTEMDELWARHGISYFWNPATDYCPEYLDELRPLSRCFGGASSEITQEHSRHPFPQTLNILDPESPGMSRPLGWVTPNSSIPHISWVARFFNDCRAAFDPVRIEELMIAGGVSVNHTYPAYAGDCMTWSAKGSEAKIDPQFDRNLRFMSDRMKEGRLWVPFLSDLLDRYFAVQALKHDLDETGCPCLVNGHEGTISSLALNAAFPQARIEGIPFKGRQIGSGMYRFVHGKIGPGESIKMETIYA